jgi:hypothetical protein
VWLTTHADQLQYPRNSGGAAPRMRAYSLTRCATLGQSAPLLQIAEAYEKIAKACRGEAVGQVKLVQLSADQLTRSPSAGLVRESSATGTDSA